MNLGGTVHLNKTGLSIFLGCLLLFLIYIYSKDSVDSVNSTKKQVNLKKLLLTSLAAAQNGGAEIVAYKDNLKIESKGKTQEGANDSVTTADFKSHCVMMATLKHNFPYVKIVSEESKAICDSSQIVNTFEDINDDIKIIDDVWVDSDLITIWIDPLDATQEYTEKLYNYVTTMVCIAVKELPVIGVIYKPFYKETYWAWTDKGKSSNLMDNKDTKPEEKIFIVSRSHAGEVAKRLQKRFEHYKITPAGGAGYKVLELIKGNADAYVHITAIKKWDICAGNAILNALGGKMTTKTNHLIDYSDTKNVKNEDGLIASFKDHESYLNI